MSDIELGHAYEMVMLCEEAGEAELESEYDVSWDALTSVYQSIYGDEAVNFQLPGIDEPVVPQDIAVIAFVFAFKLGAKYHTHIKDMESLGETLEREI